MKEECWKEMEEECRMEEIDGGRTRERDGGVEGIALGRSGCQGKERNKERAKNKQIEMKEKGGGVRLRKRRRWLRGKNFGELGG